MRAFDEMFRNGITEVRFRKIVAKKIVAMIAEVLAPVLLAEDLLRDLDADEVQHALGDVLDAPRDDLRTAHGDHEKDAQQEHDAQADDHQPVEGEPRVFEQHLWGKKSSSVGAWNSADSAKKTVFSVLSRARPRARGCGCGFDRTIPQMRETDRYGASACYRHSGRGQSCLV